MNRKQMKKAFQSFAFGAILTASAFSFIACGNGGQSGASNQSVIDFTGIQQVSAPTNASNECGIVVSSFTPNISAWWDSATFVLTNTCNVAKSVSGLQLTLSANQALNAEAFSLNSISYPVWQATTANVVGANANADALLITLNTTATIPANGTATGSFGYNPSGIVLSGLNLAVNGSTPVGSATLSVEIDSSSLSSVCNSSYACNIPIQLLGQGGTLYKTIATVTNNNLGNATVSLINLLPGSYTVAPSSLPTNVSVSATPSSSVTLSANVATNVKLNFTAQTANIGNLSFTLVNPDPTTFAQTSLAVNVTPSGDGSTLVSQANFGALTAINSLSVGNYTLSVYGLASASKGEYYSYPLTNAQVKGSNATTVLGSITASVNTNTISDTITVTGLASGDSVQLSFTDRMNGNSFIFNPETLTSSGTSQVIGKYKFIVGDTVTVNVIVNGNYQKITPFTFTQGSSAQNFTIGLTKAPVATTGTIYFHAYVPQTSISAFSNGDFMVLTGDNYTDLIMSNYIAGVMLGHTIIEKFPNMQFNKDYMYGSIFGQLLQENLQTQLYQSSSTLIAPSPNQAAVMGGGQGGPYQINSYAYDMVGFSSGGYSLANYVAIQKNIGFTLANQSTQAAQVTPASFNDKYYSPMLTAYFHLNDLVALNILENGSAGYVSSAAPNYPKCMANLTTMPNSPLEIIMNYAYNQGFYGGLVGQMASECVNMQASAFLAKYNSYANASGSSYNEYPYQIRFYLDELYNQSTLVPATDNHVAFNMQTLSGVFANVFKTLAYIDSSGAYNYISVTQANTAFNQALSAVGITNSVTLDLSDKAQRQIIFSVLENAIAILEKNIGTNFSATTLTQLSATGNNSGGGSGEGENIPSCPTNPTIYPAGLGSYASGTIVKGSDGALYQCISSQVSPWCNSSSEFYYAPATGTAWASAWSAYSCK